MYTRNRVDVLFLLCSVHEHLANERDSVLFPLAFFDSDMQQDISMSLANTLNYFFSFHRVNKNVQVCSYSSYDLLHNTKLQQKKI